MHVSTTGYASLSTAKRDLPIPNAGIQSPYMSMGKATGGSVTSGNAGFTSLNATLSQAALDAGDRKQAFTGDVNWRDPNNWLFQNLMKDPLIQRLITKNEDGTYTSKWMGIDSEKESLALSMVRAQHGADALGQLPGDPSYGHPHAVEYTAGDQAKFKELTGYNLVFAGGGTYVVDDLGNPPKAEDAARVKTMWDIFDDASLNRDVGMTTGDLDANALRYAAHSPRVQACADTDLIDQLISIIDAHFSDAPTQAAPIVAEGGIKVRDGKAMGGPTHDLHPGHTSPGG